jgi:hypothetical protein
MIKMLGSVPVKTRVPLAAWVVAGLLSLLSIASSLLDFAAGPADLSTSSFEQVATTVRQANMSW